MTLDMTTSVVYGECLSDHKDAGSKYDADFDYLAWASRVVETSLEVKENMSREERLGFFMADAFKKLGLPLPRPEDIHHGSDGQLAFLDSHGGVVRIGNNIDTDPRNFLHPHILQPLGWVTSEDNAFTIAIYPAVHHFDTWNPSDPLIGRVEESLWANSFFGLDLSGDNNIGYIKLDEGNYPVCLDISWRISERDEQKTFNAFNRERDEKPAFNALRTLFQNVVRSTFPLEIQEKAFNFHQPLRHAFFMAWPGADKNEGAPDPERMKKFWRMAHNYVHRGYQIVGDVNAQQGDRFSAFAALFADASEEKKPVEKGVVSTRKIEIPWKKLNPKKAHHSSQPQFF